MSKLYITPNEDLFDVVEKVLSSEGNEIELMLDTDNPILSNALNLKYIESEAQKESKSVKFVPKDEKGKEKLLMYYGDDEVFSSNTQSSSSNGKEVQLKSGFVSGDILENEAKNKGEQQKTQDKKRFKLNVGFSFSNFKMSAKGANRLFIILTIFLLLIIPVGLFALLWYLPTAEVKLVLKTEDLTQAITLTASSDVTKASIADGVFPATLITAQSSLSNEATPTGAKQVGEKAKGVVSVSNKTDEEVTLPSGTIIEAILSSSTKVLKYVVTEPVTIQAKDGTTIGKADVNIEANDIGEDYNLDSGVLFQVGELSSTDIVAENTNDISGGESRDVKVVSQSDYDELLASTKQILEQTVRNDLKTKAEGKNLASNSISIVVLEQSFSHNVGAESDLLTLNLIIKAEGLVVDDEVVKSLEGEIKPNIPEGFIELPDSKNFEFDMVDSKQTPEIIIKYNSKIAKEIDIEKIRTELVGSSLEATKNYLKNLDEVLEYGVRLKPKLPEFLMQMPRSSSRINISLEYR